MRKFDNDNNACQYASCRYASGGGGDTACLSNAEF
jgi:hypothetical protein